MPLHANQSQVDSSPDHVRALESLLQARTVRDEEAGALDSIALHSAITSSTAYALVLCLLTRRGPGTEGQERPVKFAI